VQAIGITVQYAGQPAEQEMLRLTGSRQLNAFSTKPLVIPPAPPDQR